MLRISVSLFILFTLNLFFNYVSGYSVTLIILLLVFIALVSLLISFILIIVNFLNNKSNNSNFKAFIIFLLPVIIFGLYTVYNNKNEVLLSAYSEGVISGEAIYFYKDGTMKYEISSLMSVQYFNGIYELEDDTFKVVYLKKKPRFNYVLMTKSDKKLLFLNDEKEVSYKFYIDKEFVD